MMAICTSARNEINSRYDIQDSTTSADNHVPMLDNLALNPRRTGKGQVHPVVIVGMRGWMYPCSSMLVCQTLAQIIARVKGGLWNLLHDV